MKSSIYFALIISIICCLVTNIAEAYKMTVISTLKEGTKCHGYVTDCRGHVLFDKGLQDCSGTCLVSQRDNLPNGDPYCPHMIVEGEENRPPIKIKGDSCFKVDGEPSKWTYKKIRCPDKLPKHC